MSTEQIWTLVGPTVAALLAMVGAWAWKSVADANLARIKAQREQALLEDEQAARAKNGAKEVRARDGLTGEQAGKIAEADFKQRVPGATDESAKSAILAAVGADPDVGESRKKDVTP